MLILRVSSELNTWQLKAILLCRDIRHPIIVFSHIKERFKKILAGKHKQSINVFMKATNAHIR